MVSNSGKQAEKVAAEYLEKHGYKILAQNWRTRMCEIDIVASKDKCVYFVEVKYRKSLDWGSGLDYITSAKQKQMNFAAEMWLSQNNWSGECSLAAVEVAGEDYEVKAFVTEL